MIRTTFIIFAMMITCISCARMDQRDPRYNAAACPICYKVTDGTCSYCRGTKKCPYCDGLKERREVNPNYSEDDIKPFSYKEPCPYCKATGVCPYCKGNGKCWACGGTQKASKNWDCLNPKNQQAAAVGESK